MLDRARFASWISLSLVLAMHAACGASTSGGGAAPDDVEDAQTDGAEPDALPDAEDAPDAPDAPQLPPDVERRGPVLPMQPQVVGPTWLARPVAVAFHPVRTDELWVANALDDSFVVVRGVDSEAPQVWKFYDYFHGPADDVMAIGFDADGTLVSCQDSANDQDGAKPADGLIGLTLWPGDPELLALSNRSGAVSPHLARLHSTPMCTGLAVAGWRRVYAVHGQNHGLDRFVLDRVGEGKVPHGTKTRLAKDVLRHVPGVPAHMAWDPDTGLLYIADPGGGRMLVHDTATGADGKKIFANPDPTVSFFEAVSIDLEEWLPAGTAGLVQPAGVAWSEGRVWITDHGTGRVLVFDVSGRLVAEVDTGRGAGALGGIAVRERTAFITDLTRDEVFRIDPQREGVF